MFDSFTFIFLLLIHQGPSLNLPARYIKPVKITKELMVRNLHRVLELVDSGFERYRVLVVGDVMLDTYVWGHVHRISPEAPAPAPETS